MDIQAKIHITKEYIYVYGKLGQQPVKVKNQLNKEMDKLVFAVALFEVENGFRIRGGNYSKGVLKEYSRYRTNYLE